MKSGDIYWFRDALIHCIFCENTFSGGDVLIQFAYQRDEKGLVYLIFNVLYDLRCPSCGTSVVNLVFWEKAVEIRENEIFGVG